MFRLTDPQQRLVAELAYGWVELTWTSYCMRFADGRRGRVLNSRTVEAVQSEIGLVEMHIRSKKFKIETTVLVLPGREHLPLERYELVQRGNEMIIKAAQFAAECHAGQIRKYNGLPYITHPIRVAGRMATHPIATDELVAAAFLHDVVEDCGVELAEIREYFGRRVAYHVGSLTNSPKVAGESRESKKLRDRERLSRVPDEAKVLKMIDRIDNMREIPNCASLDDDIHLSDTSVPFAKVYGYESLALLEVLCDSDPELAAEYKALAEGLIGG